MHHMVNMQDTCGNTVLHILVERLARLRGSNSRRKRMYKRFTTLLRSTSGTFITTLTNDKGLTVFDLAIHYRMPHVAHLLVRYLNGVTPSVLTLYKLRDLARFTRGGNATAFEHRRLFQMVLMKIGALCLDGDSSADTVVIDSDDFGRCYDE